MIYQILPVQELVADFGRVALCVALWSTSMDIAERIKAVRGELPQEEFALRVGVHKSSLGRYERGDSVPDMNFARQVCFVFGINPQWFLLGSGPRDANNTLDSVSTSDCAGKIAALAARIVVLEEENANLKEAKELYKDVLNAYKRLYEVIPPVQQNDRP